MVKADYSLINAEIKKSILVSSRLNGEPLWRPILAASALIFTVAAITAAALTVL